MPIAKTKKIISDLDMEIFQNRNWIFTAAAFCTMKTTAKRSSASQSQLLDWVKNFEKPHPRLYLIHGEPGAKTVLRERLSHEGWAAEIPHHGKSITF